LKNREIIEKAEINYYNR